MNHDLLHIQGKPYVLVPLHEYRMMSGNNAANDSDLPDDLLDEIYAGQDNPIKILRKYRGLTQAELAEAAELSRPYLTEIETGKKDGSVGALKSLALALDIPAGILLR
ncbi:MAG TPA: XRE family transcriptional regulator [Micavibrio sp.]|nr:XRE family transcriptional regulator [Micavibrio sp.]HIL29274.1 XRE family transcriptional regulator [Micavibrio sp.]|tara:strand:+ start:67 stop:390 length:324 start_codon:yes stop_codon:yes gene_type:complete